MASNKKKHREATSGEATETVDAETEATETQEVAEPETTEPVAEATAEVAAEPVVEPEVQPEAEEVPTEAPVEAKASSVIEDTKATTATMAEATEAAKKKDGFAPDAPHVVLLGRNYYIVDLDVRGEGEYEYELHGRGVFPLKRVGDILHMYRANGNKCGNFRFKTVDDPKQMLVPISGRTEGTAKSGGGGTRAVRRERDKRNTAEGGVAPKEKPHIIVFGADSEGRVMRLLKMYAPREMPSEKERVSEILEKCCNMAKESDIDLAPYKSMADFPLITAKVVYSQTEIKVDPLYRPTGAMYPKAEAREAVAA